MENVKTFLEKNRSIIVRILMIAIIFLRCDFGIVQKATMLSNLTVDILAFLFCIYLFLENKKETKDSIFNIAILWLALFSLVQFAYGHFGIALDTKMYSMQYHILTVLPAFLIYEMLWHHRAQVLEITSDVGAVVVIATFIVNVCYDHLWIDALHGEFYRIGEVPGGTVIDTGNLYLLMLIPMAYSMIIEKQYKRYLFPSIVAIVGILLAGSKSSVGPLIVVFAIMMVGASKDKQSLRRNIVIIAVVGVIGLISIMTVPILYEVIGSRIVELFTAADTTEYDLHTSTGQRMAVLAAFKAHFWEAPLFGHGFYAFKYMPYSQLEEYVVDGVVAYRNIQTHMNFMELLFSFGFFGLIAYYWFPVVETVKVIRCKYKLSRLIGLSFLISFLSIDLGLDMFYKYLTPYYTYLLVFILIKLGSERLDSQED